VSHRPHARLVVDLLLRGGTRYRSRCGYRTKQWIRPSGVVHLRRLGCCCRRRIDRPAVRGGVRQGNGAIPIATAPLAGCSDSRAVHDLGPGGLSAGSPPTIDRGGRGTRCCGGALRSGVARVGPPCWPCSRAWRSPLCRAILPEHGHCAIGGCGGCHLACRFWGRVVLANSGGRGRPRRRGRQRLALSHPSAELALLPFRVRRSRNHPIAAGVGDQSSPADSRYTRITGGAPPGTRCRTGHGTWRAGHHKACRRAPPGPWRHSRLLDDR
jgi:hypothetical protein